MKRFSDFNLLDFGNTVQIVGFVLQGNGITTAVPFPDEKIPESELVSSGRVGGGVSAFVCDVMEMSTEDWTKFLYQTDVLDVELQWPKKAIIRKNQRQIDQNVAWEVFERDGYRCSYCGKKAPLSVDHVDLWECGGSSVSSNLVSACKPCNRARGSMPYDDWLKSPHYLKVSANLPVQIRERNVALVSRLEYLKTLRVDHVRSR